MWICQAENNHLSIDKIVTCIFFSLFLLSKIVDRIDSDTDGYITTAELKAWIKRVQKRYVFENVAKVWTDYDLNKDNKISWDEYKQATYGYYLGMAPHVMYFSFLSPISLWSILVQALNILFWSLSVT